MLYCYYKFADRHSLFTTSEYIHEVTQYIYKNNSQISSLSTLPLKVKCDIQHQYKNIRALHVITSRNVDCVNLKFYERQKKCIFMLHSITPTALQLIIICYTVIQISQYYSHALIYNINSHYDSLWHVCVRNSNYKSTVTSTVTQSI